MTDPKRFEAAPPLSDSDDDVLASTPGGHTPRDDDIAAAIAAAISRGPNPAREKAGSEDAPSRLAERLQTMQAERANRRNVPAESVTEDGAEASPRVPEAYADAAPQGWGDPAPEEFLDQQTYWQESDWQPYAPVLAYDDEPRGGRFRRAALAGVGAVALVSLSAVAAFMLVTSGGPGEDPAARSAGATPEAAVASAAASDAEPAKEGVSSRDIPEAPQMLPASSDADSTNLAYGEDAAPVGEAGSAAASGGPGQADAGDPAVGDGTDEAERVPLDTATVSTTREVPPSASGDAGERVTATAFAAQRTGPEADFPQLEPGSDIGAAAGDAPSDEQGSAMSGPVTATGRVTSDVNMRTGPENDAEVVRVVPNGADVDVVSCDNWCEVAYSGERGFIYSSFVETSPAEATSNQMN